jgi:hypothetical protein
VAGKVQPPVTVRTGTAAAGSTTVPRAVFTAMLPKFILAALAIEIGVTMVADDVAIAETCAIVLAEKPVIRIASAKNFKIRCIVVN